MAGGRPETWTEDKKTEAINLIIDRICEGESLRNILIHANREIYPSMGTFLQWVKEDKELADHYARAMEVRSEMLFDEILEISDESNADITIGEKGEMYVVGEAIQRSRLKIDARKWALSKMMPKKYGDKIDVTSGGDKVVPNIINLGSGIKPPEDE